MLGQAMLLTAAITWLRLTPSVVASPVYQLGRRDIHGLQARQDEPAESEDDTATPAEPEIIQIPSPVNFTGDVDSCQGYQLTEATILDGGAGIDGTLQLLGNCTAYGPDYETLTLTVRYETDDRIRVRIVDSEGQAHVVPDDVASWPEIGTSGSNNESSNLSFEWEENPFSFRITRKSDNEVIFDTTGQALIFEQQYLRVRSSLAEGSHIQGLGQHNDNFTLPIDEENYVRTLWTRDAYGTPSRTNLYGAHPIYVNQKIGENPSASGVFFLNSNGMDIKFPNGGREIEYNILGGVVDMFFLNGPTPADVARQGTQVWGVPAEVPYWSLGFHSCKYGYLDIVDVAETVNNYTNAGIPIQTQWMDIDYMFERWIQTLDPDRFALDKVQYVVDTLQNAGRDFIVMVDPAVFSGTPNASVESYETYQSGVEQDVFMRTANGELYEGVVWPGPTVFPDWTAPNAQSWWTAEFARFFGDESGFDVSGIWLDMNEPANFLPYLEANIYRVSLERPVPPPREPPRIIPRELSDFPEFQAGLNISDAFGSGGSEAGSNGTAPTTRSMMSNSMWKRQNTNETTTDTGSGDWDGQTLDDYVNPELDNQWLYPPYRIDDRRAAPSAGDSEANVGTKNISDFSARTDIVQANGARTYDEHNLYGSRHAIVTRNALLARKPTEKPFTIARSSFSGSPSALWLGDNISSWEQYIQTIRQMLQFAAVQGIGMVGADSCGFGGNSTETLCARWAWLGAFNTFYRNHNELGNIPQEFYRWPLATEAAVAAGKTRLRLIDYIYSFLHQQHVDGTPAMWPLSWVHPTDENTINIEHQFYFGPALLVSPVVAENATSATFYVPNEIYYDFFDLSVVQGQGAEITVDDVGYETMPLHIRGGSILPLRTGDANTTDQNRELPFHLVVAPNSTDQAWGYLRLDDGISLDPGDATSDIWMIYGNGTLEVSGSFGYGQGNVVDLIVFAGQTENRTISINGQPAANLDFDSDAQTLTAYNLGMPLGEMTIVLGGSEANDTAGGSVTSSSTSVESTSASATTGATVSTVSTEPTVGGAVATSAQTVAETSEAASTIELQSSASTGQSSGTTEVSTSTVTSEVSQAVSSSASNGLSEVVAATTADSVVQSSPTETAPSTTEPTQTIAASSGGVVDGAAASAAQIIASLITPQ